MNLLLSILLVVLIIITTGSHVYFVWKKKDYRTLITQVGIISLAILAVILVINDFSFFSIAKLMNTLSPLEK